MYHDDFDYSDPPTYRAAYRRAERLYHRALRWALVLLLAGGLCGVLAYHLIH